MSTSTLLFASEEEQKKAVFSANRPGWVDQICRGDIIVGGINYGMGSSRPAARSLRNLGIAALIAESINGLFFRNAVNYGLLALECPGVYAAFEEGQTAEILLDAFVVRNRETGAVLKGSADPPMLLDLMLGAVFTRISKDRACWSRQGQASDKSGVCRVAFSVPSASLSYSAANSSRRALMARVVTPSATWRARAAFRR